MDLKDKAVDALTAKGFAQDRIVMAKSDEVGEVGEYMAMLWMPPNPDHIKIQQITAIQSIPEPDGVVGRWKGVSKDDIDTITL